MPRKRTRAYPQIDDCEEAEARYGSIFKNKQIHPEKGFTLKESNYKDFMARIRQPKRRRFIYAIEATFKALKSFFTPVFKKNLKHSAKGKKETPALAFGHRVAFTHALHTPSFCDDLKVKTFILSSKTQVPEDLGDGHAACDAIWGRIEGRPMIGALVSIEGPWDSALMAASISGTEQMLPEPSRTSCGATVFRKP
ncbi:uncharacterized protein [Gossypium hirsutum]|uniref:Uncharacterized protein n=1 Tax=Gossypium hirsutum TaxID=3635 RepID=A0ABM2YMZ8_GOSHI|nr:uncharacterized protein LOC121205051 [Gossypium hirsutum]